jgi:hypothetical protein
MMNASRAIVLTCASVVALAAAGAQDVPNLRGKVKSVSGTPISGVEIRVEGSALVTRSDQAGNFAFVNAPKGPQTLLLRLLGYLPAKAETRVPTPDPVEVAMLPTPRILDTVRVVASVNVLAGIVVDHKDRPIPGATVEMLAGTSNKATTDSSGWFTFTSVKNGPVLVRARKLGFSPLTTSIRLDDWRGLVIHLDPIDDKLTGSRLDDASGFGNTSMFVWTETQQRLAMRGSRAILIPREELAQWEDFPLGQAITRTKTGATLTADLNAARGNICVLLNGKNTVGPSTLENFRTAEVEFVELYPPGTETSGSVVRYLRAAGCRRVQVPGSFTAGVFYAVVWLRT